MKIKMRRKNTERILNYLYENKKGYLLLLSRQFKLSPNTLIGQLKALEKDNLISSKIIPLYNKKEYYLTTKGLHLFYYFKDLHKFELEYMDIIFNNQKNKKGYQNGNRTNKKSKNE